MTIELWFEPLSMHVERQKSDFIYLFIYLVFLWDWRNNKINANFNTKTVDSHLVNQNVQIEWKIPTLTISME